MANIARHHKEVHESWAETRRMLREHTKKMGEIVQARHERVEGKLDEIVALVDGVEKGLSSQTL